LGKLVEKERGVVNEVIEGDENNGTQEANANEEQGHAEGRAKRKKGKTTSRHNLDIASDDQNDNDDLYAEPPKKTRKSANGGARGGGKGKAKAKS